MVVKGHKLRIWKTYVLIRVRTVDWNLNHRLWGFTNRFPLCSYRYFLSIFRSLIFRCWAGHSIRIEREVGHTDFTFNRKRLSHSNIMWSHLSVYETYPQEFFKSFGADWKKNSNPWKMNKMSSEWHKTELYVRHMKLLTISTSFMSLTTQWQDNR